jgi:hypothetical protein
MLDFMVKMNKQGAKKQRKNAGVGPPFDLPTG